MNLERLSGLWGGAYRINTIGRGAVAKTVYSRVVGERSGVTIRFTRRLNPDKGIEIRSGRIGSGGGAWANTGAVDITPRTPILADTRLTATGTVEQESLSETKACESRAENLGLVNELIDGSVIVVTQSKAGGVNWIVVAGHPSSSRVFRWTDVAVPWIIVGSVGNPSTEEKQRVERFGGVNDSGQDWANILKTGAGPAEPTTMTNVDVLPHILHGELRESVGNISLVSTDDGLGAVHCTQVGGTIGQTVGLDDENDADI